MSMIKYDDVVLKWVKIKGFIIYVHTHTHECINEACYNNLVKSGYFEGFAQLSLN